ncbi:hypothetical protein CH373_18385 [Leptospira perolatii]|uniref:Uncharacterized protein n=1 Tax=Leptospira perolatii TaxID=2023191 RepID=A0A2M9ZI71_9LEPT|nr:hypothetical protein [Leptospira perolatii]PJZ70817.1 hypothetical protein CH360_04715 [Leptospira perolatii]PJZ71653.1 hypothetical protein CH373_18385 [Leptospira perolatii]
MGHDSLNRLPKLKRLKLEEFIFLMGYEKVSPGFYFYYKDDNYRHYQAVHLSIDDSDRNVTKIFTRTNVWCSTSDLAVQNRTIRLLKERFGGSFATDDGEGRYFKIYGKDRENDEAGCYLAYERFLQMVQSIEYYVRIIDQGTKGQVPRDKFFMDTLGIHHPLNLSAGMAIPFLLSALENYFRSTYIALIKYKANESFFRKSQIHRNEIIKLVKEESDLFESLSQSVSFQNISSLCNAFKEIDNRINLEKILKIKYKKSNQTLYDYFHNFFEKRHKIVHRFEFEAGYDLEKFSFELKRIKLGTKKIYYHLIKVFKWQNYR